MNLSSDLGLAAGRTGVCSCGDFGLGIYRIFITIACFWLTMIIFNWAERDKLILLEIDEPDCAF
jgi:hypothetical protein